MAELGRKQEQCGIVVADEARQVRRALRGRGTAAASATVTTSEGPAVMVVDPALMRRGRRLAKEARRKVVTMVGADLRVRMGLTADSDLATGRRWYEWRVAGRVVAEIDTDRAPLLAKAADEFDSDRLRWIHAIRERRRRRDLAVHLRRLADRLRPLAWAALARKRRRAWERIEPCQDARRGPPAAVAPAAVDALVSMTRACHAPPRPAVSAAGHLALTI